MAQRAPHRSGPDVRVGNKPGLPLIFTGPLVFDSSRLPLPHFDKGALTAQNPLDLKRLQRWRSASIGVRGRPDWVFIKLYSHGFIDADQPSMVGEQMRRFLEGALNEAHRSARFIIHFATAREAFNMVMAAVDGKSGSPHLYRDYRLLRIMKR